jgi:hypothetical protein
MGRYFTGEIEGKFWFGVQSSIAADRFGVTHSEPNYVSYWYQEEDLQGVEDEIKVIEDNLGNKIEVMDKFFDSVCSYTDEQLEELGISRDNLSEYADLKLGIKIRDCIKENGGCSFNAEL